MVYTLADGTQMTRRKRIKISHSGALSAYQTKFAAIAYESAMQNDFDDIRFTEEGGTNIPYWIESKTDGTSADIWVKCDLIDGDTYIWMYYGNAGLTAGSNGSNTFMQYHGAASSSFLDSLNITVPFKYKGKIKPTASSHLILWGLADGYYKATDGILLQSYSSGGTRAIRTFKAGAESLESESPALSSGTTYTTEIFATSASIHGYIDGNEVSDGFSTNIPDTNIGLIFDLTIGTGEQEWSFVCKYTATDPTTSVGTEEHQRRTPQFL